MDGLAVMVLFKLLYVCTLYGQLLPKGHARKERLLCSILHSGDTAVAYFTTQALDNNILKFHER